MPLQAFSPLPGAVLVARRAIEVRQRGLDYFSTFLSSLHLFQLSKELDQPLSSIASLEDLQQKIDRTLQALENAFEKASGCCSHWTIGGLFGAGPIASSLEQLLHKTPAKFHPQLAKKYENSSNLHRFGKSFAAELAVGIGLNSIALMHSFTPALALLSLISSSFLETLIQHLIDTISLQSFCVFTKLIRERLVEYTEFRLFVPEYRVYDKFFNEHRHQLSPKWQASEPADNSKIFKTIYLFGTAESRRALLRKILKVLKRDEIFRSRLQKRLPKLGFVFLKTLEVL
ncbi:MAG: hypothetical protein SW833_05075 [Cyanobacteriota bacterium]|nr:hypothetical protein [Cyanobacteriota bacterium]